MARSKPISTNSSTSARMNSAYWERQKDIQAASSRPSVTTPKQPTAVSTPTYNYTQRPVPPDFVSNSTQICDASQSAKSSSCHYNTNKPQG